MSLGQGQVKREIFMFLLDKGGGRRPEGFLLSFIDLEDTCKLL